MSKRTLHEEWEWLNSKESASFRRVHTRRFNAMFPKGHRTSLRSFARSALKNIVRNDPVMDRYAYALLKQIPTDAFDLLVRYGTDYSPQQFTAAPPEPLENRCFENSWLLSRPRKRADNGSPLVYVEGIVVGSIVRPMLHAWNARGLQEPIAIDWTHYPVCRWSRYIGIPLSYPEYSRLCRRPDGKFGPLFHKDHFCDRVRTELVTILDARKVAP